MTGAYLCLSPFNCTLPRLEPHPMHISVMIHRWHKACQRRMEYGSNGGTRNTLQWNPSKRNTKRSSKPTNWTKPVSTPHTLRNCPRKSSWRVRSAGRPKRASSSANAVGRCSPGRYGDAGSLQRTSPHGWSREEREMDRAARGVSEFGYVAKVKRSLGHKLRDGRASKREDGAPEA
ncbi:hypothetical protein FIBSPDRAFT_930605 [Athelia psychrophila]|uniref:Uncharacterized protein n=1 Tax=Athelia psychrophila TaxID=1759441 RepID=A0A166LSK9_9AGAM|nr:hypothetical protein FIBSPDRAFT_930605 [Fibularhizoctonia sp. CBS 109695]